ncbi:nitrogen fixation protein NifZ [Sulfuricurvum sp.]|uniref:nitrogen fixation protein NifZ n=1 Tax=Sulfuricurvum sp. TaxID=2025608 RepID=UPI002E3008C0|nr:nitrogen fixation protein NifZ [Sulfuricurvum sp.]HEX5329894.1 nitrogen fixation protein NifZ [Sulfuricurvum sp.]
MESMPVQAKQPLASDDNMPINDEARKTNLYKMSTKDEILSLYRVGERVRLTKSIRNDGTYPYAQVGDVLIEAGAEGYVRKIGDFLQTIRIYEVNFIEEGFIFGCREAELESALEDDGYDEVAEELRWIKEHRAARAAQKAAQSQEEGE